MRHNVDNRKLGRKSPHRRAMFANMAASLILKDRIETTLPKAKELRRIADRLVTMGKQQTLHARRRALALIRDKRAVAKLFNELSKRFTERAGGYTRILKLGHRLGDAAAMAIIEYIPSGKKSESHEDGHSKKESGAAKKDKADHAKKEAGKAMKHTMEKKAKHAGSKPAPAKHQAKRSLKAHKATRSGD